LLPPCLHAPSHMVVLFATCCRHNHASFCTCTVSVDSNRKKLWCWRSGAGGKPFSKLTTWLELRYCSKSHSLKLTATRLERVAGRNLDCQTRKQHANNKDKEFRAMAPDSAATHCYVLLLCTAPALEQGAMHVQRHGQRLRVCLRRRPKHCNHNHAATHTSHIGANTHMISPTPVAVTPLL
jgi:hypothetical protein